MEKTYVNKYGTVTLTSVTDEMKIRNVLGENIPQEAKFNIDTAEQLALITGNEHIQISFEMFTTKLCYVIYHTSPSTCYVCKIANLEYNQEINATQELETLNNRNNSGLVHYYTNHLK